MLTVEATTYMRNPSETPQKSSSKNIPHGVVYLHFSHRVDSVPISSRTVTIKSVLPLDARKQIVNRRHQNKLSPHKFSLKLQHRCDLTPDPCVTLGGPCRDDLRDHARVLSSQAIAWGLSCSPEDDRNSSRQRCWRRDSSNPERSRLEFGHYVSKHVTARFRTIDFMWQSVSVHAAEPACLADRAAV